MNAGTKVAALNKYRSTTSNMMRQPATKVLVVYDVQVKEISHIPLVINYGSLYISCSYNILTPSVDLPKAVEEYAHR